MKINLLGLLVSATIVLSATLKAVDVPMYSIEQRNMFFGKLYVGSQFVETSMIFDTMSPMITVSLKRCEGASMPSNYDFSSTDTETAIMVQTLDDWEPLTGVFRYNGGATTMQGNFFTD